MPKWVAASAVNQPIGWFSFLTASVTTIRYQISTVAPMTKFLSSLLSAKSNQCLNAQEHILTYVVPKTLNPCTLIFYYCFFLNRLPSSFLRVIGTPHHSETVRKLFSLFKLHSLLALIPPPAAIQGHKRTCSYRRPCKVRYFASCSILLYFKTVQLVNAQPTGIASQTRENCHDSSL